MGKTWTVINTIKDQTMTYENNENSGHKDWKQFGGRKCAGALEKSGRRRFGGEVGSGEGRSKWRRGRRLRERSRRRRRVRKGFPLQSPPLQISIDSMRRWLWGPGEWGLSRRL